MTTPAKSETPKRKMKNRLDHVQRHVAIGLIQRHGTRPELIAACFNVSFDVAARLAREAASMPDFAS